MRADILPRIPHFCRDFGAEIKDGHSRLRMRMSIEDEHWGWALRISIEDEHWGWGLRKYWGWWLGLGLKIEDQGSRIEDWGSRIEEVLRMGLRSRTFVVIFFGRKSRNFEDISEPSKCPRVDNLSFFSNSDNFSLIFTHKPVQQMFGGWVGE